MKQVAIDALLPDRTYMFFSHVIKAQDTNMPLLDTILEKNIRLMDYECIADGSGKRLIAFGKYAGLAGMIDTLRVRLVCSKQKNKNQNFKGFSIETSYNI